MLVRHKKHKVYQLPNGAKITVGNGVENSRSVLNTIRDLKRVSGVEE
jgi:hypothetical protein